ncbi:MAG: hypothetical protein HFJ44_01890 [Clostridia bacterium]|jgi:uncharacterized HAD superfamily protein|nr:hypothetical protein [Clostridia bacterium]
MNIGIDIDDTISNSYETIIPYAQKYQIEELHKSPILDRSGEFSTHKYTKALHNWNEEEENIFWEKYYTSMLPKMSAKALASESIKELSKNNKIYLITARWDTEKKEVEKITIKWLADNEIVYDKLILNAGTKLESCKKYNIDLFIDDSFKNCKELTENGIRTFIMDSQVNQKCNDEKIKRVYSWPHICQEVSKIEKGEI